MVIRGNIAGNMTKKIGKKKVVKRLNSIKNRNGQNTEKPCVAGSIPALSTETARKRNIFLAVLLIYRLCSW